MGMFPVVITVLAVIGVVTILVLVSRWLWRMVWNPVFQNDVEPQYRSNYESNLNTRPTVKVLVDPPQFNNNYDSARRSNVLVDQRGYAGYNTDFEPVGVIEEPVYYTSDVQTHNSYVIVDEPVSNYIEPVSNYIEPYSSPFGGGGGSTDWDNSSSSSDSGGGSSDWD